MKKPVLIVITTLVICGMFAGPVASARQGDASTQNKKANLAPADGTQLPKPDPKFKGKIGETYKDSTPDYPMPVTASKGSPNILLILLDDVGFGMSSTFGGPVPTPNIDMLANNGLRYT